MLRTFLGWLRAAARDAVLAGVSDAAAELAGDDDPGPAVALLRARLAPALLAPDGTEADAPRGRKGAARG